MATRVFKTGASRNDDSEKLDIEAFNSPVVDRRYAEFMHKNRIQPNGEMRSGDNWTLGIELDAYMKSAVRHVTDWRLVHRGYEPVDKTDIEDILCAVIFNCKGYLFEILKARRYGLEAALSIPTTSALNVDDNTVGGPCEVCAVTELSEEKVIQGG